MSAALLALALSLAGPDSGWVAGPDGVRLYYEKIGSGPRTVIVPAGCFSPATSPRSASATRSSSTTCGTAAAPRESKTAISSRSRRTSRTWRPCGGISGSSASFRVGYSYLGFMVVLYAMDHPDHVERVVQLGPVPRRFDTEYPASLMHSDSAPVVDSAAAARIDSLERSGWARSIRRSSARSRGGRSGCGWWDRNAPYAAGREWAQTLPNARLLTVERAAHLVTADAPGIVIPAIDAFVGGRWPERAEKITSLERGRPR